MNLLEQLVALVASIGELQQKLADAQAAADELAKAKFDEGFAAGVASVNVGSDKIYSQVELDAKIAEVVAPLDAKIVELQVKVDEIPSLIESAKIDLKSELLEKFKAAQDAETELEKAFEDILK